MDYKVITPVATEPVSLAEAKLHIRQTSDTLVGDLETSQSITPGSHSVVAEYGLVGESVDILGLTSIVQLNCGTCGSGGSVDSKIQESDDDSHWQDFSGGAFTTVTEANDNSVQTIEYTGVKQYVRVVATVSVSSCSFSANVVTETGFETEDTLIEMLITAAREYCEGVTRQALATQTIEAYLLRFPCHDRFELPRPPLQSVTSVKYTDSDGAETAMTDGTDYLVDSDGTIGKIVLPYAEIWPTVTLYPVNPIKVRYVAGYSSENPIPKMIKQAMLLLIGYWYNNREAIGTVQGDMKFSVDALLSMNKLGWF